MTVKTQAKATISRRAPVRPPVALPRPKTMSVPEAGYHYFGLSKNGSYDAAARGEIVTIKVGRLWRVPIAAMDRLMLSAAVEPQAPPAPVQASRYPRSVAAPRKARSALVDSS